MLVDFDEGGLINRKIKLMLPIYHIHNRLAAVVELGRLDHLHVGYDLAVTIEELNVVR